MSQAQIVFEQSPRDIVRVCLQLEKLMSQIDFFLTSDSVWASRMIIETILQYMNVADRPDFRNKMIRLLSQCLSYLTQLEKNPHVDGSRLQVIISDLDGYMDFLHRSKHKFGSAIRLSRFLNLSRKQSYSPGGICDYHSPQLVSWLSLSASARVDQLAVWVEALSPLRQIVDQVLSFLRMSHAMAPYKSSSGSYQCVLDDRSKSLQLVRVALPVNASIYPEVNISAKRLFVYFYQLQVQEEVVEGVESEHQVNEKFEDAVDFSMACCFL